MTGFEWAFVVIGILVAIAVGFAVYYGNKAYRARQELARRRLHKADPTGDWDARSESFTMRKDK